MAGRSFTRHSNGIGNRIRAEHINELQAALEEDDARIDLKTDDGQFTAHVDNTDNPHNVTKAQVGLGNVANVAPADLPVSTAQQAALDGKADVEDAVPEGGVYGQVLTVTHQGRQWVDPPGIVYPSLLLSPDGSRDRNGPVSLSTIGTVPVVEGQYGQAWAVSPASFMALPVQPYMVPTAGTMLIRFRLREVTAGSKGLLAIGRYNVTGEDCAQIILSNGFGIQGRWRNGQTNDVVTPTTNLTQVGALARYGVALAWKKELALVEQARSSSVLHQYQGKFVDRLFVGGIGTQAHADIESVLWFPDAVPQAELQRLMDMPTAWTMQNTAVNMALQSQPPATPTGASLLNYFPPNRKIAAGGASLRIAPGASTTAISTLAAGTDVHSTGQTVTASSVSYTLIMTSLGQGFVPTTALI